MTPYEKIMYGYQQRSPFTYPSYSNQVTGGYDPSLYSGFGLLSPSFGNYQYNGGDSLYGGGGGGGGGDGISSGTGTSSPSDGQGVSSGMQSLGLGLMGYSDMALGLAPFAGLAGLAGQSIADSQIDAMTGVMNTIAVMNALGIAVTVDSNGNVVAAPTASDAVAADAAASAVAAANASASATQGSESDAAAASAAASAEGDGGISGGGGGGAVGSDGSSSGDSGAAGGGGGGGVGDGGSSGGDGGSSGSSGGDGGSSGGSGGGGGDGEYMGGFIGMPKYIQGMVTRQNTFGGNPAGPDDSYRKTQLGEYVIKKSAVQKYGRGLLDMINSESIPKTKLRGLL